MRVRYVAQHINDKTIPPELLRSELTETLKSEQSKIHPWMMGGEYLPDLRINETEICRIVLKSATMDVISMRTNGGWSNKLQSCR